MPADDLLEVVKVSIAHWNDALASCCAIRLTVAPASDRWIADEDGVNLIAFRRQTWCHNDRCGNTTTYPAGTLAMTTRYPEGAAGVQLREADIEIDARQLRAVSVDKALILEGEQVHETRRGIWVVSQYADKDPVPLETILVHELGHVLGLDDACVTGHRASGRPIIRECSRKQRDRVMFATSRKLQPSSADLAEFAQLYPKPGHSLGQAWVWMLISLGIVALASVPLWRKRFSNGETGAR